MVTVDKVMRESNMRQVKAEVEKFDEVVKVCVFIVKELNTFLVNPLVSPPIDTSTQRHELIEFDTLFFGVFLIIFAFGSVR